MFTREIIIGSVGEGVLRDLIAAYKNDQPYYLSNTINYMFDNEDDALFTTNEEILEYVKKILADEYELEIHEVTRSFAALDSEVYPNIDIPGREGQIDFKYQDIEIKIVKK